MFCVYKMKSDRVRVIDYVWNISNAKHVREKERERKKEKERKKERKRKTQRKRVKFLKPKIGEKAIFLLPASLTQN